MNNKFIHGFKQWLFNLRSLCQALMIDPIPINLEMPMNGPFTFISKHPLTRSHQLSAISRLVHWQIKSRLFSGYHQVPWIKGTRLNVRRGMHGATGNIYSGLHEFSEMGFLLHFLRPTDLFCDIGANIGSYTVLASGVVGATTISFEPDPDTIVSLRRNIEINEISNLVEVAEVALSSENAELRFSVGQDTINHIVESTTEESRSVTARRLDDVLRGRCPSFIKIDVEGHELGVFIGASRTPDS